MKRLLKYSALKHQKDFSLNFMWSNSDIRKVSDVYFIHIQHGESHYVDRVDAHQLKYVVQGEMSVFDEIEEIKVRSGECVFLRKDHKVRIRKYPLDEGGFKCITFVFTREFLRKEYYKSQKEDTDRPLRGFSESFIRLTDVIPVVSLFTAMIPYADAGLLPSETVMDMKLREALQVLLELDNRFYPALFDFAGIWKIDILDFLNENYMYNLSLAEIANYTGRSLATFKRDFAKVSELTPENWIVNKRLDVAYQMLATTNKSVREVMTAVGFRNSSHFTTAFKRKFSLTPSELKTKKR